MKTIEFLGLILIVLFTGCNINKTEQKKELTVKENSQTEELFQDPPQGSFLYEKDGEIILFDTIIQLEPFDFPLTPESANRYLPLLDSITIKACSNEYGVGNIIIYHLCNSYIKVFEDENVNARKYPVVEFIIIDKDIKLRNGLAIGLSKKSFNIIYPEAKKYPNALFISMKDQSEFNVVSCYFQQDTIYKIVFASFTSPEYEW
jgi:hypothetical protein